MSNSAMKKGNGEIRSLIAMLIIFILFILAISEIAPYPKNPTMNALCRDMPTLEQCPKQFGGDAL